MFGVPTPRTIKQTHARTSFAIDGHVVYHNGADLYTGQAFCRRYWLGGSGYVFLDATRNGTRPGTLGRQPTFADGTTWRVVSIEALLDLVRAEWRRERAIYRNS